ncbi:MAG: hypothetical protein N2257_07255 [Thermodesulfovibrionales bacterium]|nr:hypothetical protein [Thermodesulfovibrionales bacterium]
MKNYILKEYGSWSLLLFSYSAGVIAAGRVELNILLPLLGIGLLINSKQSFVLWHRLRKKEALFLFALQISTGLLILFLSEGLSFLRLYFFVPVPVLYLMLLVLRGEHSILTEIAGFLTLCLSSLIAYFSITGDIALRLYIALSLFFLAGVFRVRLQLMKGVREKITMIIYLIVTAILYMILKINILMLIPLLDNLIFALTLYRVRLQVTGWIEFIKGILFLLLLYLLW